MKPGFSKKCGAPAAERIRIMQKRKRRLGDRYDGRKIRTLPPMDYVAPFIMKTRNDASNLFGGSAELGRIENYIRGKRKEEGLDGFGFMHVIVAAYVRLISQKPGLNRFIAGQRIYQHEDITLSMMVKKSMELNAQETAIKVVFQPEDSIYEVYHKMEDAIAVARQEGDTTILDFVARGLVWMPSVLLRAFISFINLLDYFGMMPKVLHQASCFHCSLFITNLGSLGIPPVYHHLYNFGTCPAFIAFGAKRTVYETQKDGSVEKHRYIDYKFTSDERICDGHYFATAFKEFEQLLRHPEVLDKPPETVVEDID